ncbi:MAG: hypothetical protein O2887_09440 [Bacteroidetes bacterium]|nr:hypothetical protein [Bacteroidota bacterium]
MEVEKRVGPLEEILSELIHNNQVSEKRLKLMETIAVISIPALILSFATGVIALLKAFGAL